MGGPVQPAAVVEVPAAVLSGREWSEAEVLVPVEEHLTLTVNGQELITMLASPGDPLPLVVGFLFNEGIVDSPAQVESAETEPGGVRVTLAGADLGLRLFERRVLTSGCGKGFTFGSALDALGAAGRQTPRDLPWVTASAVLRAAEAAYSSGGVYSRTRGVHGCGLFDRAGSVVTMTEDIGRHNAVDKAVGRMLLAGRPLGDLFMVVTGRISSEMVGKIAKTPIPLIVSKSVPTGLALDYARRVGLCVVGRVAGNRMSVYSLPELIDPAG